MEKFVIVDGNSLINRAFYALPMLRSLSGKPCNAIYGFINMILNVISKEKPKYFVCVFDAGKHTFRHDFYAEYKGKRDKMPEDLALQLPELKKLLKAMGIMTIERAEIEADDLIGSITRKFNEEFMLVSGDKDLLQLINDNTTVWLTKKGITDVLKVDEEVLMQEFKLKPYQVIEMKSIMGDASDNIPGVAGIGKIGAEKLIQEYDNLDNIYLNIDKITGKTKEKLIESKEMAYLSKKLATIKLDVDLSFDLKDCEYSLPFNQEVVEIMQDMDFKSILNRKEFFDLDLKPESSVVKPEIKAEIVEIDTQEKFEKMLEELTGTFAIYTDTMTMSLSTNNKEFVLYTSGPLFNDNIDRIKKLIENEEQKICFDAKLLMHELSELSINLNNYFDVSLAIYIAKESDAEMSFDDALKINNIVTNSKVCSLFRLKEIYVEQLILNRELKLYNEIELPLVKVLFDMEKNGFKVDVEQIKMLSQAYHEELDELTDKIYTFAGEEFNINSPKQMKEILFDKLAIEYKGKPSTSIEVLKEIENKHEIVPLIIRYRKISKLIGTYLDGMIDCVGGDGKIHTTFMQKSTSTGRLSSREPNLQNLPIRDDEGRRLRKMFCSSFDGGCIVSADYNQIELRLMANFSGDENMTNDYLYGKDIHTATASKIFDVDIDSVTSQMRRVAKSVNFGIIYGISAYGLSQNIGMSPKEAGAFINKYMSIYPKVKDYNEECVQRVKQQGYADTIMGRIRHLPDINSSNHVMRSFAERAAKNMPLQGSASDIIKMAMIKVYNRLKVENLKSILILQIHDELVVDCYPGEEEIIKTILKQEMESVINLKVPLLVEVSLGKTLYEAK